jgi:hypothetical protein
MLYAALRLTITNICAKLYWNISKHVDVLLRTSVLQWPLRVTFTFDLETWFMRATQLLIYETYYEFSLKFVQYAPEKNGRHPSRRPPDRQGKTKVRPVFKLANYYSDLRAFLCHFSDLTIVKIILYVLFVIIYNNILLNHSVIENF